MRLLDMAIGHNVNGISHQIPYIDAVKECFGSQPMLETSFLSLVLMGKGLRIGPFSPQRLQKPIKANRRFQYEALLARHTYSMMHLTDYIH